ncbi:MAG: hypothetical protein IT379_14845 [Deltaproteobacteria bacterium]|nr:hypothetical protein [Deltaproteobacteria bacterium]
MESDTARPPADASDAELPPDAGSDSAPPPGALPCRDERISLLWISAPAGRPLELQRVFAAPSNDGLLATYDTTVIEDGEARRQWGVAAVTVGDAPSLNPISAVIPTAELVYPFGVAGASGLLVWTASNNLAIAAGAELGSSTVFHEHAPPPNALLPGTLCSGGPGVALPVCDASGTALRGVQWGSWDANGATMNWSDVGPLPSALCSGGPTSCLLRDDDAIVLSQLGAAGAIAVSRWNVRSGEIAASRDLPLGRTGTTASATLLDDAEAPVALVFDTSPSIVAYRLDRAEAEQIAMIALEPLGAANAHIVFRGAFPTDVGWMLLLSYRAAEILVTVTFTLESGFGTPLIVTDDICQQYAAAPITVGGATYLLCSTAREFYLLRMCRSGM